MMGMWHFLYQFMWRTALLYAAETPAGLARSHAHCFKILNRADVAIVRSADDAVAALKIPLLTLAAVAAAPLHCVSRIIHR